MEVRKINVKHVRIVGKFPFYHLKNILCLETVCPDLTTYR